MKKYTACLLLLALFLFTGCKTVTAPAPPASSGSQSTAATASGEPDVSQTEPQSPKTTTISFTAIGDNIIHEDVYLDAKDRATGTAAYNFVPMYNGVADYIASSDLAFINQETPITDYTPVGYPNFSTPHEAGDALVSLGFDIVNIANNHMLDKGDSGYSQSIAYWKSKNILMTGGYTDKTDFDTIRTVEKNGVKIAFLSYTYGTNGMKLSSGSSLVVPYINDNDITRQIELAKKSAELVFVSVHWGTEDSFQVSSEQTRVAQLIADCGADVIIGTHPHVVQKIEWLSGKNGNRTLCMYSLGNFISTQYYAKNMVGMMVTFDIEISENGAEIKNPAALPTMTYYDRDRNNLQVYFLEDVTDELISSHGSQLKGSFTRATIYSFFKSAGISSEYLPGYLK